jgi:hypothetical protein
MPHSWQMKPLQEPPLSGVIAIMQSEAVDDTFFRAYMDDADAATE